MSAANVKESTKARVGHRSSLSVSSLTHSPPMANRASQNDWHSHPQQFGRPLPLFAHNTCQLFVDRLSSLDWPTAARQHGPPKHHRLVNGLSTLNQLSPSEMFLPIRAIYSTSIISIITLSSRELSRARLTKAPHAWSTIGCSSTTQHR